MLRVVLCELEGVLADTAALRRHALRDAFAAEGIAVGDALLPASDGMPVAAAVRDRATRAGQRALDETSLDLLTMRAERAFADSLAGGISLTPGALPFVERAAAGTRLAIVTRARRREAEFILRLAGLEGAFEWVLAQEDAPRPKPDPDAYLRALARLARRSPSLSRRDMLTLEDGQTGATAAGGAGLHCTLIGEHAAAAPEGSAWVASLAGHSPATLAALAALAEASAPASVAAGEHEAVA